MAWAEARIQGLVRRRRRALRLTLLAAVGVLAAGCAVELEPLSLQERFTQVQADRTRLYADQEPVTGPVSLAEAMARAIKYNLDARQALMEQLLQARQLDVSSYDMLPKLAASAGYNTRDKANESLSRNTITNFRSIEPAISQDRTRYTADLGLTWNLLDFGVSYFQAKQQADRVLIAQERRRRLANSIIQQVRASFWLAASAERLQGEIEPILTEARKALDDSKKVEEERLKPPLEALRFQKALIEIIRQLETVQQDLSISKAQLAALMNLPLGQPFTLALPEGFTQVIPEVAMPIEKMETIALLNRPEMREEQYQKRVNLAEVRKAMVRMLPGIGLNTSINYDSNSYLIHNMWAEAGARLSYNLLNLFSGPATIRAAEAQEEAGDFRRMALNVATLTQVHVAYQQYVRGKTNFEQARLLESIERRINENVQQAATADAESALERIRSKALAVSAKLARDRAYAELQNAMSSLYVALGLDALPETVESHGIKDITAGLAKVAEDWQAGRLHYEEPPAAVPTAQAPAGEPTS
ncbi:TolC family protein [Azospirillum sp.]|uniref:TolC family protein n=1 Tax=Azospirillum sp. TaxID=34012 RepID=UPI003D72CCD9